MAKLQGGNITLASERVHATQPGMYRPLKQLEDELGFQFFLRKGKKTYHLVRVV